MASQGKDTGKSRRSTAHAALERELEALTTALARAVDEAAGVPEFARIASRALTASVAVIDAAGATLAVAGASKADERELLSSKQVNSVELSVGGRSLGQMRYRARKKEPSVYLVRMLTALISLELDRQQGTVTARSDAAHDLVTELLEGKGLDQSSIVAHVKELKLDLDSGLQAIALRAAPRSPQERDWRIRFYSTVERTVRQVAPDTALATHNDEIYALVGVIEENVAGRVSDALVKELEQRWAGIAIAVGRSRTARNATALREALYEGLLAANVAAAEGSTDRAYTETGAYRLLLPMLMKDPDELAGFVDETIGPLLAYEKQYQTGLIATLQTFLESDAKIEATAQRLFAHRHTVRYRLERIRDLTGLDVSTTEGREKLSLGLKALYVMGEGPPRGPLGEDKPGREEPKNQAEG